MTRDELLVIVQEAPEAITELLKSGTIFKVNDVLLTAEDHERYQHELKQSEYYDMLQGVKKVLLNSTYGATLNEFCRFHDPRLGASTTGTGRQITTHMMNTISEILCGAPAPKVKKETHQVAPGSGISGSADKGSGAWVSKELGVSNEYTIACPKGSGPIYGDTDSCYFSMAKHVSNTDEAAKLADGIIEHVNASFPEFMRAAFNCQAGYDSVIKANREVVASAGIFRAKKKYIMLVKDLEGKRIPENSPKEIKTQGSDIKLSSTPKVIREFLKKVTLMILRREERARIDETVLEFRKTLNGSGNTDNSINPLELASISSVRKLDESQAVWERLEKTGKQRVALSSHVRAAINYNYFITEHKYNESPKIIGGQKIKLIWLQDNEQKFTNIAFPSDLEELPQWFHKHFKADLKLMEEKLVDQKLQNLFDPLGWEVPTPQTAKVGELFSFD